MRPDGLLSGSSSGRCRSIGVPRRSVAYSKGSMAQPSAGRSFRRRRPAARVRLCRASQAAARRSHAGACRSPPPHAADGNLASSRSNCLLPPSANWSVRLRKRSAACSPPLAEGCFSPLACSAGRKLRRIGHCAAMAARSRPLAEGCNSPEGSFVPPLGCGLCDRSRSRMGSAGRSLPLAEART